MSSPTRPGSWQSRSPRFRDGVLLLVLFLLPLPLLAPALFGSQALAPADQLRHFPAWSDDTRPAPPWDVLMWDDMAQLLPWQQEAHRSVERGRVPLWDALQGGGAPLLANSQTSALSPYWLLFQRIGIPRAQAWLAFIQLGIAGAGMFAFLRSAGLKRFSALLGGAIYQLSGWSLCWVEFPNRHAPAAWFPVCLWLVTHSARRGWTWRATAAAAIAVSLLSSHLQFEFYLIVGLAAAALWRGPQSDDGPTAGPRTCQPRPTTAEWRRSAALGLALLGLGVALAAPQLLPSLELGRHSHRLGAVTWEAYQQRMSFAMPSWWLAQAFVPGIFGYPALGNVPTFVTTGSPPVVHFSADFYEFAVFTGVAPLFLAVNGIRQCRRSALAALLTALGAASLLLALGTIFNAPLYFLVPGFSAMAGTARMLYLYAFSIAGLAAVGMDHCQGRPAGGRFRIPAQPLIDFLIVLALGLGACASAAMYLMFLDPTAVLFSRLPEGAAAIAILFAGAVAAGTARRSGSPVISSACKLAFFVLTVGQLLQFGRSVIRLSPARDVFPATPAVNAIRAAHPVRLLETGSDWTLDRPPEELSTVPPLPPNTAIYEGISALDSYDSLNSREYIDFVTRLEGKGSPPVPLQNGNMVLVSRAASPLVSRSGVNVVVSSTPLHADNLSVLPGAGGLFIYRNRDADPPAFVLNRSGSQIPAHVLTWSSGVIVVDGVRGPGALEILDSAAPGWYAAVDGVDSPTRLYQGMFKSVPVGEGIHTVTLKYRPLSFRLGAFISAMAVGVLVAIITGALAGGRRVSALRV